MDSMRRWYEASQRRFSVRKYKAAPEETQLQALAGMADLLCAHGVRIAIGRAEQVFTDFPLVWQDTRHGCICCSRFGCGRRTGNGRLCWRSIRFGMHGDGPRNMLAWRFL